MTRVVGIVAAAALASLGTLHVYWASGGRWMAEVATPKRGGQPLFVPGRAATLVVALLLCAALVLLGRMGLWGSWLPR